MKFSGRTQMMSDYSYPDVIDKMVELGFEGVEISILDKEFKIREDFFAEETIKQLKDRLEENCLQDISIACHLDYVNKKENIDIICRSFDVARKLKTDIVIINGAVSTAQNQENRKKEWDIMIKNTKKLAEQAEKADIRLAKEFEPGFICGNSSQLQQVFHQVDSQALNANLDLGHVFLCDPEPFLAIEQLNEKIIHCHIENMKKDIHDHLLPHEGDMDLKKYLKKLKEIGFAGPLALDLYGYDYESVAEESLIYLKNILN